MLSATTEKVEISERFRVTMRHGEDAEDIHGVDFANDDGDPMDDQMHGSHCAGTIAAKGNNTVGIAGVAWKGAPQILSNSWGGGGSSSALRVAIERAEHAGVLFLAAAGNDGLNNDELPSYPANYPMAGAWPGGGTCWWSAVWDGYGKRSVDLAAPGSDIYSTVPNGAYASLSGTSMATPHVAGVAAMVWVQRPAFSMREEILLRSTVPEKALENACVTGGRLNARRALALASIYPAPRPPIHAPSDLSFVDINPAVGRIGAAGELMGAAREGMAVGGDAVITAPEDQSDVEHYSFSQDGVQRYHRDAYGNNELAVISFSGPAKVKITKFLTESYYDYLEIAGTRVSGTDVHLPKVIVVPAGEQTITWLSDHSQGEGGWTFDLLQEGLEASFQLPEVRAQGGPTKVDVVAAYGKTELWQAALSCDVSDFDSKNMAPSEAFLPTKVEFPDEHVDEGMLSGTMTLHLPKVENVKSVVNSYVVYFADQQKQQLGSEWHLPLQGGVSTLQLRVDNLALPGAAWILVAAENHMGRGPAMRSRLLDVVRSRPEHAEFTGAASAEVVSSYTDLDMDEGVEVPVVDYVEAYNEGYSWYDWGGYGGHRRQRHPPEPTRPQRSERTPRRSPFRESWMDRPNVKDFQLLWTDEALGSLPVLTSGLGDSSLFVPPSVEQRQTIAETLSAALPGVQNGQVKLSMGRASFGARSSEATYASGADLVIDFEILPPQRATAESIQLFFDRRLVSGGGCRYGKIWMAGVEAKLILLSQGGVASSRLASALVERNGQITVGEPQQVAPRGQGHGHVRRLEQSENVAPSSSKAHGVQLHGCRRLPGGCPEVAHCGAVATGPKCLRVSSRWEPSEDGRGSQAIDLDISH
eukprot:Skav207223  [mRNA]  locus=scaffold1717:12749:42203:+ [translate_table: standard]